MSLPGSSAISRSACAIASSLSTSDSAWRPSSVNVSDGTNGSPPGCRSGADPRARLQRLCVVLLGAAVAASASSKRFRKNSSRPHGWPRGRCVARTPSPRARIQRCRRASRRARGQRASRVVQPVAREGLRDARRAQHCLQLAELARPRRAPACCSALGAHGLRLAPPCRAACASRCRRRRSSRPGAAARAPVAPPGPALAVLGHQRDEQAFGALFEGGTRGLALAGVGHSPAALDLGQAPRPTATSRCSSRLAPAVCASASGMLAALHQLTRRTAVEPGVASG